MTDRINTGHVQQHASLLVWSRVYNVGSHIINSWYDQSDYLSQCLSPFQDIILLVLYNMFILGGQSCIDNPDVNQIGTKLTPGGRQVIIPNTRLNCTVRITHIAVSLAFGDLGSNPPVIQIWRPTSPGSSVYRSAGRVRIPNGAFIAFNHLFVNLTISNSKDFDFLPGDVIGYYQPLDATRLIWSIETNGYTSFSNNANSARSRIDISSVDNVETDLQPLIEITFGKDHAHNITTLC